MITSGGLEVFYTFTPVTGNIVWVLTDILALPAFTSLTDPQDELKISLEIEEVSNIVYAVASTFIGAVEVDKSSFPLGDVGTIEFVVRTFIYDENISVYVNDVCVYTYTLGVVSYPEPINASILVTGGTAIELSNMRRTELQDQREAIYVDYESSTENAIQSIVQQRPVEINAGVGRTLEFTYLATKDTIAAHHVKTYTNTLEDNVQISSDGIVYYADVGVSINADTAEEVGLVTRMYRLSELNSGAVQAAGVYQKKALQRRNVGAFSGRFDPRLEIRDIYAIDADLTGTKGWLSKSIIVEGIQIKLEDGAYKMSITGRKYL
jgi:hypothetical protein